MAQNGRAGVALVLTAVASFIGGILGVIVMALLSPVLAGFALRFGPAEYFAVMVLGLVAATVVGGRGVIRGLSMVCLGLLLGTIGVDVNSGVTRFTFGLADLRDGIGLVVVAMGLFGVSEIIASLRGSTRQPAAQPMTLRSLMPNRDDWARVPGPALRGSAVGSFFGTLPGAGQTIAAFVAYALEKRLSRNRDQFGHGAPEGVITPEAANNAAAQTAFIPTLTLGIPGSTTMALMLGALMIHGITPGPRLIADHPALFWGLIASFILGNLMLLVLNIPLVGLWARLLRVPPTLLYPIVAVLICLGVYSLRLNVVDIWLTLGFGLLGYAMRLWRFEPAPLLIGFVLGPMIEEYFRRAMLLSRGDPMVFLERPGSAALLGVSLLLLVLAALQISRIWRRRLATG